MIKDHEPKYEFKFCRDDKDGDWKFGPSCLRTLKKKCSDNSDNIKRHLVLLDEKKGPAYIVLEKLRRSQKLKVSMFGLGEESKEALSNLTVVRFSLIGFFGTTVHEYDAASVHKLENKTLIPALLDTRNRLVPDDAQDVFDPEAEGIDQVKSGDGLREPNERQREALKNSVKSRVSVVHGPPGTGKSSIIPNFCRKVRRDGQSRTIVIVCESNKAVGVDVSKVKVIDSSLPWPQPPPEETCPTNHVVTVIGNVERVDPQARPYHIDVRARRMIESEPDYKEIEKQEKVFEEFINEKSDFGNQDVEMELKNFATPDVKRDPKRELERWMQKPSYDKVMRIVLEKFGKKFKSKVQGKFRVLVLLACIIKGFEQAKDDYFYEKKASCCKYILEKTTVFVSTVASLSRKEFSDTFSDVKKADLMIVDEAGTVSEESMPLILSLDPSYLVLVGDHKQLPPFSNMRRDPVSFMERCADAFDQQKKKHEEAACEYTMLNKQYRMTPRLCDIVSTLFYDSKLITDSSISKRENDVYWLRLHQQKKKEEKVGNSFVNYGEVKLVVSAVKKVMNKTNTIKVITFYKSQCKKLEVDLKRFPNVKVCTVDSAQGSEADIVIISCVRNNEDGDIGFLRREKRVNVAISRAKEQLIIIGSIETFTGRGSVWRRLIDEKIDKKISNPEALLSAQETS
mmetsp:Transcript_20182/g.42265  ORF Transcript_20182/g.42265 Transcript_20182/m.42265 type:complete len:682 (+) Transcript_20182:325-2370(+)